MFVATIVTVQEIILVQAIAVVIAEAEVTVLVAGVTDQAMSMTAEANHRQAVTIHQAVQAVTRRQDQAVRRNSITLAMKKTLKK